MKWSRTGIEVGRPRVWGVFDPRVWQYPNHAGTCGQLLMQQPVFHHRLVQGADQRRYVTFELGDLFGVRGP